MQVPQDCLECSAVSRPVVMSVRKGVLRRIKLRTKAQVEVLEAPQTKLRQEQGAVNPARGTAEARKFKDDYPAIPKPRQKGKQSQIVHPSF